MEKIYRGMANGAETIDHNFNNGYGQKVGDIHISIDSTNPSTRFGGTWERFGQGKVLVGVDEADADFSNAEKTGGEKTHQLTVDEMPSHQHSIGRTANSGSSNNNGQKVMGAPFDSSFYPTEAVTNPTGGDIAHNNLQPFITVFMWRRTA